MSSVPASTVSATILPFPARNSSLGLAAHRLHARERQSRLMDAVHAGGGLDVAADDVVLKSVAARLHVLGLVAIAEIGEGGGLRRLRASESIEAAPGRAWRLSRASQ